LKTKFKAADLEAAIMKRLATNPDCAGITYVYVKATGQEPPEDTWRHTLISRRPNSVRSVTETKALHDTLNEMRKEFDLIPD
jgi:hypothetical protein